MPSQNKFKHEARDNINRATCPVCAPRDGAAASFDLVASDTGHRWARIFQEFFIDLQHEGDDLLFFVPIGRSGSALRRYIPCAARLCRFLSPLQPAPASRSWRSSGNTQPRARSPRSRTAVHTGCSWRADRRAGVQLGRDGRCGWRDMPLLTLRQVQLNLVLQFYTYALVVALCSKKGDAVRMTVRRDWAAVAHGLQVSKRIDERVYASPSRRQMDAKARRAAICSRHSRGAAGEPGCDDVPGDVLHD